MKAIIIQDHDAANLLDMLKLENFQMPQTASVNDAESRLAVEAISHAVHRRFHYIVCRWLQEQGANVVR